MAVCGGKAKKWEVGAVLLGERQGKEGGLGQGSIHWLAVEKLSESISTHKVALYR